MTISDKYGKGDNQPIKDQTPSFAQSLENGIKVNLSEKSRLDIAKDIDSLVIKRDKNGIIRMSGESKDGKQRISMEINGKSASFEVTDADMRRSYNNKMYGEWTYRDLTQSNLTRYRDSDLGSKTVSQFGDIFAKVKSAYQQRGQDLQKPVQTQARG